MTKNRRKRQFSLSDWDYAALLPAAGKSARRGNCYVACEVFYHLLGGRAAGLTPAVARLASGETHWFLRQAVPTPDLNRGQTYRIIDPSRGQFTRREQKDLVRVYANGRGTGFLTRGPSKRAWKLIDLLTWQKSPEGRRA